ncbi:MAG: signal recognition particle protein Srp19 [Candidatus Bathyarchaeota archaeon]|nr:MAG: signal recognition particle protein Srp19 [Candidatus Bathyarchaeota archaeon]
MGKTRSEGRRVPKKIALESPKISELISACSLLGLETQSFPDAKYSRSWWENCGYLLVKSRLSKTETLRRISDAMRQVRAREKK